VLQLYVAAPNSPTARPQKELQGFEKVFLQAGEERIVDIKLDKYATSFWDEIEEMWKSEAGVYEVLAGTSSEDIVARGQFRVDQTRYWRGL
jgi:beta-glucosidase